jgi:hypothetical protein
MPRFLLAAGHRARARPNGAGGDGLSESSPCLPARRFNIRQLTDVSGCNLQQHLSCNWRWAIRYSARALPGRSRAGNQHSPRISSFWPTRGTRYDWQPHG